MDMSAMMKHMDLQDGLGSWLLLKISYCLFFKILKKCFDLHSLCIPTWNGWTAAGPATAGGRRNSGLTKNRRRPGPDNLWFSLLGDRKRWIVETPKSIICTLKNIVANDCSHTTYTMISISLCVFLNWYFNVSVDICIYRISGFIPYREGSWVD